MTLYVVSVWLHIAAAATWIGSMVFFAAVIVPLLRHPDLRATAPTLLARVGPRFRVVGWISLATLAVTGVMNLRLRGYAWSQFLDASTWAHGFGLGRLFLAKLGLVAFVLLLTLAHELTAARTRRVASLIGRTLMLTSLAILFFAVAMVRGW